MSIKNNKTLDKSINVTRAGNGQAKRDKIAAAAEYFQTASRQLKSANKVSAADWLIKEREKMRSKRYYL